MRVNICAEEMTENLEIISKKIEGHNFTGLRFYLHLPVTLANGNQVQGPFLHHPDDDDSSAVTFWGKRDLRDLLKAALVRLDAHYAMYDRDEAAIARADKVEEIDKTHTAISNYTLQHKARFYYSEEQDSWNCITAGYRDSTWHELGTSIPSEKFNTSYNVTHPIEVGNWGIPTAPAEDKFGLNRAADFHDKERTGEL